mmetsp:Transcript_35506/g.61985  ORF Transcript_35506/g.61985 Transcript_35506/m.61985 type:complete len:300 (-) Transcript_35506:1520-2419(-)
MVGGKGIVEDEKREEGASRGRKRSCIIYAKKLRLIIAIMPTVVITSSTKLVLFWICTLLLSARRDGGASLLLRQGDARLCGQLLQQLQVVGGQRRLQHGAELARAARAQPAQLLQEVHLFLWHVFQRIILPAGGEVQMCINCIVPDLLVVRALVVVVVVAVPVPVAVPVAVPVRMRMLVLLRGLRRVGRDGGQRGREDLAPQRLVALHGRGLAAQPSQRQRLRLALGAVQQLGGARHVRDPHLLDQHHGEAGLHLLQPVRHHRRPVLGDQEGEEAGEESDVAGRLVLLQPHHEHLVKLG